MSIEAINWALFVPIGGNAKVILLGLANHAHPDGSHAYPSWETLASYAHCNRATVYRTLIKLERDKWIERDGMAGRGQIRYRLRLDREVAKCNPSQNATVAAVQRGGVAPAQPEPSVKPSQRSGANAPSLAARESNVENVALPDEFEHLRPHLKVVHRLLTDLAEAQHAKAINPLALAHTLMARPRKPLVAAAHDFIAWACNQQRPRRDVLSGYRNWLDRCDDLAAAELLTALPGGASRSANSRPAALRSADRWSESYREQAG